jgi:hypothetical protein
VAVWALRLLHLKNIAPHRESFLIALEAFRATEGWGEAPEESRSAGLSVLKREKSRADGDGIRYEFRRQWQSVGVESYIPKAT